NDPFQRGAVAEAIGKGFCGDAFEGEEVVIDDGASVFRETHTLDAPAKLRLIVFDAHKRVLRLRLVVDVQVCEAFTCTDEGTEVAGGAYGMRGNSILRLAL